MTQIPLSVLILTLNEEINLPGCLESVAFSDDIVVFDSYSTDRTAEIAEEYGAQIVRRKFDNYAAQRSAALHDVDYKHTWILMVDADERIPEGLKEEISEIIKSPKPDITLYRARRKDYFFGKWLKRSSGYPTWFGKLFRAGAVHVKREINEEYHTDGKVGHLNGHFIHYPFSKGIAFWLDRHNRYSSMEAEVLIKEMQNGLHFKNLFSADPTIRRKFLKQLAFRMPYRPLLVFCYLYFVRMGFLDGMPGLIYCRLRAIYEYMIDLKVRELGRLGKHPLI